MNVTVETLAPCKKLVRVEIAPDVVEAAFEKMTRVAQKHAQLPGYRPGKAPKAMIVKTYGDRIEQDVKQELLSNSYRDAMKDKDLKVVAQPQIEEIQFGRGLPYQYAATVEVEPDFEMPQYKGLQIQVEKREVTDANVDEALERLRAQAAQYVDIQDRGLQDMDFAIVNYTGTIEGQSILEVEPQAQALAEQKDYPIQISKESLFPGFTDPLIGMKPGEKRETQVTFPEDFQPASLAGKTAQFEVELKFIKERQLPELDDAFAQKFEADTLDALRAGVQADLQEEAARMRANEISNNLVKELLDRVTCDLPDTVVQNETRNVIFDIVETNRQRGISREMIDENKDQIFSSASISAKNRVKAFFLFERIAELEDIKVSNEEMVRQISYMAMSQGKKPEALVKELRKRGGFQPVHDSILRQKVLAFLEKEATIEEVLPAPVADAPEA